MAFDWLTIIGWFEPHKWLGKILSHFRKAKIIVYFDKEQTYHTRYVVDMGSVLGYFCHVMVRNEGKEVARKCRGRLLDVMFKDSSGKFVHHQDFVNPVVLKWAHEPDFEPKDIENGMPRRLDLCYTIQSIPNILSFFAPPLPNGIRTQFPKGIYQVKVMIDSENAGSFTSEFTIDFNGQWNQILVSEINPTNKPSQNEEKRENIDSFENSLGTIGELWGSLRGVLRNHPTFAQIKDLVGAAGLPVEKLSHLQQKQSGGASKGQLMDAIDGLVNELDNQQRDKFVAICTKELLRRYEKLREEVEAVFNQHGWSINNIQEIMPIVRRDSKILVDVKKFSDTKFKKKKQLILNPFSLFLIWYRKRNIDPAITAAWVGGIVIGFFTIWAAYILSPKSNSSPANNKTIEDSGVVNNKLNIKYFDIDKSLMVSNLSSEKIFLKDLRLGYVDYPERAETIVINEFLAGNDYVNHKFEKRIKETEPHYNYINIVNNEQKKSLFNRYRANDRCIGVAIRSTDDAGFEMVKNSYKNFFNPIDVDVELEYSLGNSEKILKQNIPAIGLLKYLYYDDCNEYGKKK